MYDLIERLKQKPEHHRRRVAFGVSGGITAIIFILWASIIFPHDTKQIALQKQEVKPTTETPIATLRNGVAQVYEAFQALMQSTEDTKEKVDFETEYKKIKDQVEKGEIDVMPNSNLDTENGNNTQ